MATMGGTKKCCHQPSHTQRKQRGRNGAERGRPEEKGGDEGASQLNARYASSKKLNGSRASEKGDGEG